MHQNQATRSHAVPASRRQAELECQSSSMDSLNETNPSSGIASVMQPSFPRPTWQLLDLAERLHSCSVRLGKVMCTNVQFGEHNAAPRPPSPRTPRSWRWRTACPTTYKPCRQPLSNQDATHVAPVDVEMPARPSIVAVLRPLSSWGAGTPDHLELNRCSLSDQLVQPARGLPSKTEPGITTRLEGLRGVETNQTDTSVHAAHRNGVAIHHRNLPSCQASSDLLRC